MVTNNHFLTICSVILWARLQSLSRFALLSRKQKPELASCRVAWFSEHFNSHKVGDIFRASRNLSRGCLTNSIFYCALCYPIHLPISQLRAIELQICASQYGQVFPWENASFIWVTLSYILDFATCFYSRLFAKKKLPRIFTRFTLHHRVVKRNRYPLSIFKKIFIQFKQCGISMNWLTDHQKDMRDSIIS